ncbi:MAG TPA: glycosyl hydrolase, partial [Gemmatimonadaceae bacterium]|nr:glycosyl hydrolase [Gemmatimonadaceae bacterium]
VFVAAMGHAAGPNPMRGVYRSTDGGKHWQRVLFVDDSTGAVDLAMDPTNPRILYAAMWRMRREPWGFEAGGGRSGLWKSVDGGDTWIELTSSPGFPRGPIGRIGVAVSPSDPQRLYASIEAPPQDSTGGIFRSDDAGRTWQRVNGDQEFMVRPWYYSVVVADPKNENTVYVMNLSTWRSIDGGRTFQRMRVPHGDTHVLWVDPSDPSRMISGNDGGATVSFDGGQSWSTQMNQPTAQFYHVITDDQWPYRIYGAQQDNTTVSIVSRSDYGVIGPEEFFPVGGGESGYIAPKPGDPNTVVAGAYTGTMTRMDVRTKQVKDISPGLNNYDGWPASQVPNRFQWTYPLFYSRDGHTLYAAANRVFRSTNDGDSWTVISPDLTRHDPKTLGPVGGPVTLDMTGTEWYATIFALAESPLSTDILWAGSDDGLIHVSRDHGATWTNVTPPQLGAFTRVSIIEPSHFDRGTAYVAANRYQQDDLRPYLFKTTDYGRTWTAINSGIPVGAYTRTIREDPVRRGLLFAGTETGIYYSTDDGALWEPLQLNLPRVSVRDLTFHGADLIAATHGRAIWVLDNITPLRQLTDDVRRQPAHLFAPDTAVRWQGGHARVRDAGENPPDGAVVDFYLRAKPDSQVKLEFLDASGTVIRTFTSAAPAHDSTASGAAAPKPGAVDDTLAFDPADSTVPTRPGLNRFAWDLRYPDTRQVKDVVNDEGTTSGPVIAPGAYQVRLTVDGVSQVQPLVVREDPRVKATQADLEAQLALALKVQGKTNALADAVAQVLDLERQLDARTQDTHDAPFAKQVADSAARIHALLESVRDSLSEIHSHADEITLHFPIRAYNMLLSLAGMVQGADAAPTAQESELYTSIAAMVDRQLAKLQDIEAKDIAAFNAMMTSLAVPAIVAPKPAEKPIP